MHAVLRRLRRPPVDVLLVVLLLALVVTPVRADPVDLGFIDGIANGLATISQNSASSLRKIQNGFVRSYALSVVIGVVVVTHGQLATELVNAAEMIVGDLPQFTAVSIGWHEDVNDPLAVIELLAILIVPPALYYGLRRRKKSV